MKPETSEWIEKAEGDLKVARREMGAVDPVWNVIWGVKPTVRPRKIP